MGFLRGFTVNAAAGGLTFVLAFANQALIARGLGVAGRGRLALAATTVTVAAMVFGEWLARGNGFVGGRDPAAAGAVWRNTVVYSLAVCLLFAAAALAGSALGGDLLPRSEGLLLAAMAAAAVAQKGFTGLLQGRDRLTAYAMVPLVFVSGYLLCTAVALGWLQAGLPGVLAAWCGGAVLAAVLAAAWSRAAGAADGRLLRATALVGSRGAVSATLIFLLFRSDVYLVQHYLGTEPLGIYAIAVVIAEMMQRGPNIAGAVLLPKVLRGVDDDHAMSLAVGRWTLCFSLLAAAGVVAVGAPLIGWVFGAGYAGAYVPLVWMLPGLVAAGFGSVLNTKLAGHGYPPVTLWAPAAALALNVVLNVLWIPRLGLAGAALSTSVAYALWTGLVTVAYVRLTRVPVARLLRRR